MPKIWFSKKPPKRLKIGLWWYDFKFQDVIKTIDKNGKELNYMGYCDHYKRSILISPKACETEAKNTIWHEVIHALSYQFDIKLSEHKVKVLANGIEAVIKDNPNLMNLLKSQEDKIEQ